MKKHFSTIILILIFLIGLSLLLYPTASDYWNSFHQTRAINSYAEAAESAEAGEGLSLTINYQHEDRSAADVLFSIYRVADVSEDMTLTLTEDFQKYPVSLENLDSNGWKAASIQRNRFWFVFRIKMLTMSGYMMSLSYQRTVMTVMVEGNAYIGCLDIPAIDLFLPVMSSWSYAKLKIAPCRYGGSAYTGELVIAAHNYRSHFGSLRYLNTGDQVIFTDADGNQFVYSVGEVEVLAPAAVEEMLDSGWDLTLFTCTYGGRTRLAIRCELE